MEEVRYHADDYGRAIDIAASDHGELFVRLKRWSADNCMEVSIETGHCVIQAEVRSTALRHLRDEITRALDDHAA